MHPEGSITAHNVQLDSALQVSLEELQRANTELQQSRLRIVSAGDAERRKLERNLHDGAQQHLVAMAVKLRMVEELVEDDPHEATKVIAELRDNLKDAIAELRVLAHGIFPPLLMSGGSGRGPSCGRRCGPRCRPRSTPAGVGRYSPEVESTVYFCCLEAMQNAGKHAGEDAEIAITVEEHDGSLTFTVSDDGIGFEPGAHEANGHGFVNMTDRLGAVRGAADRHIGTRSGHHRPRRHPTALRCGQRLKSGSPPASHRRRSTPPPKSSLFT